jgi:cell division protein FtsQ
MARRSSAADAVDLPAGRAGRTAKIVRILGSLFNWTVGVCLLIGGIWTAVQIEQFVIRDNRFLLAGPPEPGTSSDSFQVVGLVHASEQSVIDVFSRDFGRSVYLCPIRERRRRLLAIDWVKDATVSRIWPNQIVVRIIERQPVAFVQLPAPNGNTFYGLVDADGVMLDPGRTSQLSLPVLTGVPEKESEAVRRERVRSFLRLQSDMGPFMDRISEVDVSDPGNIRITQSFGARALTLMLGNRDFLQRYRNFTDNYPEIQRRLPNAVVLDLRLKDRITAVVTDVPDSAPGREHGQGRSEVKKEKRP